MFVANVLTAFVVAAVTGRARENRSKQIGTVAYAQEN